MVDLLVYLLLAIGVPLSEEFARPSAERLELTCSKEAWQWIDWPERCRECAALPHLSEAALLPPLVLCEDRATFAACHAHWLEAQQSSSCDRWHEWQQWRNETAPLVIWWASARDAQRGFYSVLSRRRDLGRAKAMMCQDDWWAMRWPDCVVWGRLR
jgi:hypothetical protein